jgi:hypothetical protein
LNVRKNAGVVVDRVAAHAAEEAGDVIVGWHSEMRVDLFTPSISFA